MQRKIKILATIVICAMAISLVLASSPAIASWIDNSVVTTVTSTANPTFTTTVTGVATNAENSPITLSLNGQQYTYTGANFGALSVGPINGDPNTPSTVGLSMSGFVTDEWVALQVTIKDTGTTTLTFGEPSYYDYYCYSDGSVIPWSAYTNFPAIATAWGVSNTAAGYSSVFSGFGYPNGAAPNASPTSMGSSGFVTDFNAAGSVSNSPYVPPTQSNFQSGVLDNSGLSSNWEAAWVSATTPTQTLAPGATFTYYVYIGLGGTVPFGLPASYFSINVPLMVTP